MIIDTLAAIDIGSNAIRLLVSNIETYKTQQEFKKLAFVRVPIRLGEDVFTTRMIGPEKQQRLSDALVGFAYIMKSFRVLDFRAYATSAMREALNGADVVEQIYKLSGIRIEIISGEQEADTIYAAGGLKQILSSSQTFLYVDVGGGSTEVIVYSDGSKIEARSFRLGTVRMLTGMVDDAEMDAFKSWLKEVAKQYSPTCIIGSGGNINKVQRLLGKKDSEPFSFVELSSLYKTLKAMSYEERVLELNLNTYRADVIVPALKIFYTVAKTCKIQEIAVPRLGLADGIIKQLYELRVDNRI